MSSYSFFWLCTAESLPFIAWLRSLVRLGLDCFLQAGRVFSSRPPSQVPLGVPVITDKGGRQVTLSVWQAISGVRMGVFATVLPAEAPATSPLTSHPAPHVYMRLIDVGITSGRFSQHLSYHGITSCLRVLSCGCIRLLGEFDWHLISGKTYFAVSQLSYYHHTMLRGALSLTTMKYFCINHGDQGFFSFWNCHKCFS